MQPILNELAILLVSITAFASSLAPAQQTINLVNYHGKDLATSTRQQLAKIAICESGGKQFDGDGKVIQSYTDDFGLFQINGKYHLETSKKMGLDIMTEEGNIKYALYLVRLNGLRDWSASQNCWAKN